MSAAEQLQPQIDQSSQLKTALPELQETDRTRHFIVAAIQAELASINRQKSIDENTAIARMLLLEQLEIAQACRLICESEGISEHSITQDETGINLNTVTDCLNGILQRENIRVEPDQFSLRRMAAGKRLFGKGPVMTLNSISMSLDHAITRSDFKVSAPQGLKPKLVADGQRRFELTAKRLFGTDRLEIASPEDHTVVDLVSNFMARIIRARQQCVREVVEIRERYLD